MIVRILRRVRRRMTAVETSVLRRSHVERDRRTAFAEARENAAGGRWNLVVAAILRVVDERRCVAWPPSLYLSRVVHPVAASSRRRDLQSRLAYPCVFSRSCPCRSRICTRPGAASVVLYTRTCFPGRPSTLLACIHPDDSVDPNLTVPEEYLAGF